MLLFVTTWTASASPGFFFNFFFYTSLIPSGTLGHLTWVRLQQAQEQLYPGYYSHSHIVTYRRVCNNYLSV